MIEKDKRPSARRHHPSPTLNYADRGVADARVVLMRDILRKVESKAFTYPVYADQAVATLLGDIGDPDVLRVSKIIVELVSDRLEGGEGVY